MQLSDLIWLGFFQQEAGEIRSQIRRPTEVEPSANCTCHVRIIASVLQRGLGAVTGDSCEQTTNKHAWRGEQLIKITHTQWAGPTGLAQDKFQMLLVTLLQQPPSSKCWKLLASCLCCEWQKFLFPSSTLCSQPTVGQCQCLVRNPFPGPAIPMPPSYI